MWWLRIGNVLIVLISQGAEVDDYMTKNSKQEANKSCLMSTIVALSVLLLTIYIVLARKGSESEARF